MSHRLVTPYHDINMPTLPCSVEEWTSVQARGARNTINTILLTKSGSLRASATAQYCMLVDRLPGLPGHRPCTQAWLDLLQLEQMALVAPPMDEKWNGKSKEGKWPLGLLWFFFFTTSTKCYLYTLLLLVLSPPKSSELHCVYCMPCLYEVQRTPKGSRVLSMNEWLVWL